MADGSVLEAGSASLAAFTTVGVMAVDAWAQPPHPDWLDRVPEVARLMEQSHSPLEQYRTAANCEPDKLVAAMDAAGVRRLMLSAWRRPEGEVVSNEYVHSYCKAYPDRFCGVACVDLEDPVAAVAELEDCVKRRGFKALRVVQWLWRRPPTDALYYPLYVKCVELDIPVCLQVGHTGPLMPSETGRPVPYIDEVALRFPSLKIVCGHIGYPWTDEMIAVAWKHPNVYIDTSAYLPRFYPPALVAYMGTSIGRSKVLFGSNFPQLTWERCMAQVKEMGLDDATREAFLWRNAERVFKLGPRSAGDSATRAPVRAPTAAAAADAAAAAAAAAVDDGDADVRSAAGTAGAVRGPGAPAGGAGADAGIGDVAKAADTAHQSRL